MKCVGEEQQNMCPYCQKLIKYINRHVDSVHKDKALPQLCTLCRKIVPNSKAMRKHWTQKIKTRRQERQCNFCLKKFRKLAVAMDHVCITKS